MITKANDARVTCTKDKGENHFKLRRKFILQTLETFAVFVAFLVVSYIVIFLLPSGDETVKKEGISLYPSSVERMIKNANEQELRHLVRIIKSNPDYSYKERKALLNKANSKLRGISTKKSYEAIKDLTKLG